ncbi:cyclin-like protein interacting with PHO85 [Dispira simplex]|nr:cyclin-like protein interacting with PHO85 [Dispira simplex]
MSRPPAISIYRYLQRIVKYLKLDNRYLLLFLVYLERITNNSKGCIVINSLSLHRLVISSLVVAHKFYCDRIAPNTRYAEIGGIPLTDMNLLEVEFLFMCQFDLLVSIEELEKYGIQLWQYSLGRQVPVSPPMTNSQRTSTTTSSATVTRATSARMMQEMSSSIYDSQSHRSKFANPQQRSLSTYDPFSKLSTSIPSTPSTPSNMTIPLTCGDIIQCTCNDHGIPKCSCLALASEISLPQQGSVRQASAGQNEKHVTTSALPWGTPVTQTTQSPPQTSVVTITIMPTSGRTTTVAKSTFSQIPYDGAWLRLLSSFRSLASSNPLDKIQSPLISPKPSHVTSRISTLHAIPSADPVDSSCRQSISKLYISKTSRYANTGLASNTNPWRNKNTPPIKSKTTDKYSSGTLSTALNLPALSERNPGKNSDPLPDVTPNHQALLDANYTSSSMVSDEPLPAPRRRSSRFNWSFSASDVSFTINPLLLSRKRVRVD